MNLIDDIVASHYEMTEIRRDLHRHPELAYEEHRTADIVAERLSAWGIPIKRGLGGTGVVGTLKCGHGNRAVGLRADLDALAMGGAQHLRARLAAPRQDARLRS